MTHRKRRTHPSRRKPRRSVRRMRRLKAATGDGMRELNAHQAAAYLGISVHALRGLLRAGSLRYAHGTSWYATDDIHDYLLSQAVTREELYP
jgi:hypothetical protein